MADQFDAFLARELAPAPRPADRRFVARVSARILLDQRLRAERRAIVHRLGLQVLALAAVAVALAWLTRAAPVAAFFAESPAAGLAGLLAAFGLLAALFSFEAGPPSRRKVNYPTNSSI